ncbi:M6 family metalloprotease domain protein [Anaerofustis stercorihominis DSM 17244]|uniref:M6 family metalloprotease domain protein n=1 Tax=Anaerofustis stercorihominis DSM 17244 TaxID=445971 RepID=B1C615_9FIRM|nr:hypothetical protein [Anaerofustis stercorihominis]EDS73584.1 M6 family metalloprotease domain protein [Anaerofustis stercorihominis DSM 17244]
MKLKKTLIVLSVLLLSFLAFIPSANASTKEMGNLVFIVRFKSDTSEMYNEDSYGGHTNFTHMEHEFNQYDDSSIKESFQKYMKLISNGKVNVTSYFPQVNDDNRTITYITLDKDKSDYSNGETFVSDCLKKAKGYEDKIDSSLIDKDNDGYIDNVTIMAQISQEDYPDDGDRGDLLWSHKANFEDPDFKIAGKSIFNYNVLNSRMPDSTATTVHEFIHCLGILDLYTNKGGDPVGTYDIMAHTTPFPSHLLSWNRKVLGYDDLKEEVFDGTKSFTLHKPYSDKGKNAVMVRTSLNENEYFVFEYRKKTDINDYNNVDQKIPYSGLICYRVNDALSNDQRSNLQSNYIYVFRPGETGVNDNGGNVMKAALSIKNNPERVSIGSSDVNKGITDNAIVYTNGANSMITAKVTDEGDDYITFDLTMPKLDTENQWETIKDNGNLTFGDSMQPTAVEKYNDSIYVLNQDKVYEYKNNTFSLLGGKIGNDVRLNSNMAVVNGEVYVFYPEYIGNNNAVVLKKYEGGKWVEKWRAKTGSSFSNSPYAVNLNNELYMVYDSDNKNVKVVKWNGSGMDSVGNTLDAKYIVNPRMVMYKNSVYLMYADNDTSINNVSIYKLENNIFKKVHELSGGYKSYIDLCADNNGLYAFGYNGNKDEKIVMTKFDGSNWNDDTISGLDFQSYDAGFGVKNDVIYMGTIDNGTSKIYYLKDVKWNKLGNDIYSKSSDMSFFVDSKKVYALVGDNVKYQVILKSKDAVTISEEEQKPVKPPIEDDKPVVRPPVKISLSAVKSKSVSYNYNAVKVSWGKVKNASGYYVYRSTSSKSGFKKIKTLSYKSSSYINSGLTCGRYYYYRVVAYNNKNGMVTSKYNTVKVKPSLKSPSVKLKSGKKKAIVKYNKVSGASGYKIYRSTKKSKGYKLIKTTKSRSYTNKKLKSKKTYYYKVRAYKKVGKKTVYSSYSSIKKVKVR